MIRAKLYLSAVAGLATALPRRRSGRALWIHAGKYATFEVMPELDKLFDHRTGRKSGMSALFELFYLRGVATSTRLGGDQGRSINIGAADALALAGHGGAFRYYVAVVTGDTHMRHTAILPVFHDARGLLGVTFDTLKGLLGITALDHQLLGLRKVGVNRLFGPPPRSQENR
jgi:hypothetical protein